MKALIIIGSETDKTIMEETRQYLDFFGIENTLEVASAHRTPDRVREMASGAEKNGFSLIITAAGMAAALPGVVAAYTSLPVLGVPLEGGLPGGLDALYATVQMPAGVPVGTLAVGKAGARNAAILTARIFALTDKSVASRLETFRQQGYKLV
ncbi:MAG TPA: 5-(carboxyamino)imidazole ribonucleotide mutase [Chitinophagaceae bacterium]|nr:5-(carboxyamino)imidazole ribonucleotide mutase [Chitinophagaceae bacterium]